MRHRRDSQETHSKKPNYSDNIEQYCTEVKPWLIQSVKMLYG